MGILRLTTMATILAHLVEHRVCMRIPLTAIVAIQAILVEQLTVGFVFVRSVHEQVQMAHHVVSCYIIVQWYTPVSKLAQQATPFKLTISNFPFPCQ